MMDISIFLAKFWGWYFMLFFVLFMVYPKRIKQMFLFAREDQFMIILSILGIIIGLLHILAHNIWVTDWRIIITLFGWFSLMKGISQFAFPGFATKWVNNIDYKWFQFILFLLFLVGLILLNQAYQWVLY
ncbi:hypothetical protein LCM02_09935 [Lutimonas saemankumensis]|uniref:hypothetical protein n=1 Tax=Lutimonas saemankumensis TaxID=483016 RepID=UPI001CD28DCC|nr:hypothetical protein [Lutimonas saemankumensis]MCA0932770.1 hypothetical protein [Lutimonas saemankumensis]